MAVCPVPCRWCGSHSGSAGVSPWGYGDFTAGRSSRAFHHGGTEARRTTGGRRARENAKEHEGHEGHEEQPRISEPYGNGFEMTACRASALVPGERRSTKQASVIIPLSRHEERRQVAFVILRDPSWPLCPGGVPSFFKASGKAFHRQDAKNAKNSLPVRLFSVPPWLRLC